MERLAFISMQLKIPARNYCSLSPPVYNYNFQFLFPPSVSSKVTEGWVRSPNTTFKGGWARILQTGRPACHSTNHVTALKGQV